MLYLLSLQSLVYDDDLLNIKLLIKFGSCEQGVYADF